MLALRLLAELRGGLAAYCFKEGGHESLLRSQGRIEAVTHEPMEFLKEYRGNA